MAWIVCSSVPCASFIGNVVLDTPQHTALLAFGGAIVATPLLGGLYTGLTMLKLQAACVRLHGLHELLEVRLSLSAP